MTTMAHDWKPSPARVELLKTIFAERVAPNEPNRDQFWTNLTQNISNVASYQSAIAALKERPRVGCLAPYCTQFVGHQGGHTLPKPVYVAPAQPVAPDLSKHPKLATEAGLYRDPSDGTLYRLTLPKARNSWDRPELYVSVYSNKAVYRRLTTEGRMVKKGKWNRLKAQEGRNLLHFTYSEKKGYKPVGNKVLAVWFMSDEEKLEWAVGTCLMCWKPLIDAVSVFNSIGPVCAKNWNVQLHMPPEA